mmetsp:Transcript_13218/g.23639  ORF Transcript_13218/g.23639 Transcript_13218/m.23639 type:complete len:240 (+) Transcript_13218:462-1181(+)
MLSLNAHFSSVMITKITTERVVWINHIHSSFLPTRERKLEEKGMMEGGKNSTKKVDSRGRTDMVNIVTAAILALQTVDIVATITVIVNEGGIGVEPAEGIKRMVAGGRKGEDARADVTMTIMQGGKRNGGRRHQSRDQDLDRFHRRCRGPRRHRRRRVGGENIAVAVRRENERSTAVAATTVDLAVVPNTIIKMRRRARSTTMLTMLGTKRRAMRMSSSIKCKLQNKMMTDYDPNALCR